MNLTTEFKEKVRDAVLSARENYGGSDHDYAKKLGINNSIYSRLKKGETDRILSDGTWLTLGRELNVTMQTNDWKIARTRVYSEIESSLNFCKEHSESIILVDACGIGKTFCAKHIIRGIKNGFYVDCSQGKTKQQFIRLLARIVGVDHQGRYVDVKNNLKYFLNMIEKPVIVLDEAGDLDYPAFLEIKELWNGTSGECGWYMMGADGLRAKIKRGIDNKKVGYSEIFSRYSDEFVSLVPTENKAKLAFYRDLLRAVATVNVSDESKISRMVNACLDKEATLRHLKTLIKISK